MPDNGTEYLSDEVTRLEAELACVMRDRDAVCFERDGVARRNVALEHFAQELQATNERLREQLSKTSAILREIHADLGLLTDETQAPSSLEARVRDWVISRVGPDHMHSRERAMRLFEEAVELAQAEGITAEQVCSQAAHVFERPAGEPRQEAGGVAVCLLGWCAARGLTFQDVALAEIERIEAQPAEEIRGSLARKADADLVTCVRADDAATIAESEHTERVQLWKCGGEIHWRCECTQRELLKLRADAALDGEKLRK